MTNVVTSRAERTFALLTIVLFTALASLLASFHEPWHDELQAWRIAIDSRNLVDLAQNLRYEGHPMLFYLLLRAVGMLSRSWTAAVVFHLVIACATAFIVLRFAPFSRLQRVLVIGGYFFLYEYTVLVRSYGIGALFALGACAAWCAPRRRTHVAVLLILLLANTSAVGLALALALTIAFTFDALLRGQERWWARPATWTRPVGVGGAAAAMAFLVGIQIMPPADARYRGMDFATSASRLWMVGRSLSLPARALVPFASAANDDSVQWGVWLFEPHNRKQVVAGDLLALSLMLAGVVICMRRQSALLLWLAGSGGLLVLFTFFHGGAIRHHGYIAISLIAAAWLAFARSPDRWPQPLETWTTRFEPFRRPLFSLMLLPMVLASVQLGVADTQQEFSDAPAIAALLRRPEFAALSIVGLARPWPQTVAALLDKPVYLPAEERAGTWVGSGRIRNYGSATVVADSVIRSLFASHCRLIVLSSDQQQPSPWLRSRSQLLQVSARIPMSGSRMYVWLVHAPASPTCPTASEGT